MKKSKIILGTLFLLLGLLLCSCESGAARPTPPLPSPSSTAAPSQTETVPSYPSASPEPPSEPLPTAPNQSRRLLAVQELTGAKLWLNGSGDLLLCKGEQSGLLRLVLPEDYHSLSLVDYDPTDRDVSISIQTRDGCRQYDVVWSSKDSMWIEPVPADETVTLDIAAEPSLDKNIAELSVPSFLDPDQQLLYVRTLQIYEILFGADAHAIEYAGQPAEDHRCSSLIYIHDMPYEVSTGRYSNWADFNALVHSVFTDDFWQIKNTGRSAAADSCPFPIFMKCEGKLAFIPAARGCGNYYNENFPDQFRLISKNSTEIVFEVIGHYTPVWPKEDMTQEDRDSYRESTCEYLYCFPIRMVLTDEGWRFDEFYSARTDEKSPADEGIIYLPPLSSISRVFLSALVNNYTFTNYTPYGIQNDVTLGEAIEDFSVAGISAIDLDGDNVKEILLQLNHGIPFGTQILHYSKESNQIYGFMLWLSQFSCLKADGTYSYVDTAERGGFARISFLETRYETIKITYHEPIDGKAAFFVEKLPSTEAEYIRALEHQDAKADLPWLDYSLKNIIELLS